MALLLGMALLPTGMLALNSGVTAVRLRAAAAQEASAATELIEIGERARELQRLRTVTRALAANAGVAAAGQRLCNQLLSGLGKEFAEFSSVVILDQSARVRCAADSSAIGQVGADEAVIADASRRGDVVMQFVSATRPSHQPTLLAVAPINGAEGLYAGLSRETRSLLARADGRAAQPGGYAALVDGRGQILQVDGLAEGSATLPLLKQALVKGDIRPRNTPLRIGDTWAVGRQLLEMDLYLLHGWRAPSASLPDTLRILWALAAPLLLWLSAVGVSWWAFESYVARPLSTLDVLARAYARGEDTATPANFHNAPEEFLSLRRTLAAMAKTLRGREKRIAEALQEERALLREVNHRVKNNLQVVASILSILSRAADNEQQATGLARAQDRIQLLALAQNEIHSSGEVHDVRLDKLAADICRALVASRGSRAANINLQTNFVQTRASVDYAVPFAFLVGESLLQALDAVADGARATINLSLTSDAEQCISFTIVSPDLDGTRVTPPITHRIIDGFARQIGATVEYAAAGGFLTRIRLHKSNLEMAH